MNNSALQVFAGGWKQLIHAKFQAKQFLQMGGPVDGKWKPDGTILLVADGGSDMIEEFTAGTPWDVTTLNNTGSSPDHSGDQPNVRTMDVLDDGSKLYLAGLTGIDQVYQYNIDTPWDITTMNLGSVQSFNPDETAGTIVGLKIIDKGRKLFLLATDIVFEYNFNTPSDVSGGMTFIAQENLSAQSGDMTEIEFSTDGQFMYALSRAGYRVFRYRLNTRNTMADGITLLDDVSLTNGAGSEFGLFIRPTDGKKLYTIGFNDDSINCYDMSLTENESLITQLGDEIITELGDNVVVV